MQHLASHHGLTSVIRIQRKLSRAANLKDALLALDMRRPYLGGSGASIVFVEDSRVDYSIARGVYISHVLSITMATTRPERA